MSDTVKCKACGADNDLSFSMCQQCLTPLTAYSGQVTGEHYEGKLSQQVKALKVRPIAVGAMVAFHIAVAILIPLRVFLGFLPGKVSTDPDQLYQASLSSAFHSITAFVVGLVMIPLAGALGYLAWATWKQVTWSWNAAFASLAVGIIALGMQFKGPSTSVHVVVFCCLMATSALGLVWLQPKTKAWYGL